MPTAVSRDDLIRDVVRALHTCTEADKELTVENTVIGVVGEGERFHILEGEAVAPFLLGLSAVERPPAMEVEADAAAPAGAGAGAGADDGMHAE